jgi:ankyrin repeat protein
MTRISVLAVTLMLQYVLPLQLLSGQSGLIQAVQNNDIDVVTAFLKAGQDPNVKAKDDLFPLYIAAANNRVDMVKLLLDHHADINARTWGTFRRGDTALGCALWRGYLPVVQLLLERGAELRYVYPPGQTMLGVAADYGTTEIARLLIRAGADVNAYNQEGWTPLHAAASGGFPALVALLLDSGARINSPNKRTGATALNEAAFRGQVEVVRLLIRRGADINERDREGASPLDEAAWRGFRDIAALLLESGAEVNRPNTQTGATPLNEAAFKGRADIAELLLAHHADAGAKTRPDFPRWKTRFACIIPLWRRSSLTVGMQAGQARTPMTV